MSQEIDNRIVQMEFRNQQFQQNAEKTMKTLDELERSLDFEKSGISKSLDVVSSKFTNMGIVASAVLGNLATDAYNFGKTLVKSLTIDQIGAGFNEYELKMGSVQTIMASTGETLDVVSDKLNELNLYADRTIYSFSDMTANIGKFTNSGVKLNDAVAAIQGVANLAAVSGANAQNASHAMYNFAQALSAGYVKLIDWKSIETANMATVEFKEELIKTALELGTIRKEGSKYITVTKDMNGKISDTFDATSMFNDSLSHQWMTTDVLTKTLSRYTDETTELGRKAFQAATELKTFSQMFDAIKESAGSGWAETMEIIFGNYDAAIKLWTGLFEKIDGWLSAFSDKRNNILKAWQGFGGRDEMVQALTNVLTALEKMTQPMSKALDRLFEYNKGWRVLEEFTETLDLGPVSNLIYESMVKASRAINTFTESLIPSEKTIEQFTNILQGVFSLIGIGIEILKPFVAAIGGIVKAVSPLFKVLSAILSVAGRIITALYQAFKNSPAIQQMVKMISNAFDSLYDKINAFSVGAVAAIEKYFDENQDVLEGVKKTLSGFNLDGLENIVAKIKDFFGKIIDEFKNRSFSKNLEKTIGSANRVLGVTFGTIIDTIYAFIGKIFSFDFEMLLDVGIAAGVFAGVKRVIKGFRSFDKIFDSITGFMGSVEQIGELAKKTVKQALKSVKTFTKGFGDAIKGLALNLKAEAFVKMSVAIAILVGSLYLLTRLDTDKVNNSLKVILVICGALALVALAIGKAGNMLLNTDTVFNRSIQSFIRNTTRTTNKALKAFRVIFASFSGIFSGIATSIKLTGIGLLLVAIGALFIEIATTVSILSKIDTDGIKNLSVGLVAGFAALAVALATAYAVFKTVNKSESVNAKSLRKLLMLSLGVSALATTLRILSVPLSKFKDLGIESVAKSIGILAAFVVILGNTTGSVEKATKALPTIAKSLTLLGASLIPLSFGISSVLVPLLLLSKVSMSNMGVVLISMASLIGFIAAMAPLSKAIHTAKDEIPDLTIAFFALSGAVDIMAGSIKTLSEIGWTDFVMGFTGFVAILTTVTGLFLVMAKIKNSMQEGITGILNLSLGMALLGMSMSGVIVGVMAMATIGAPKIIDGFVAFVSILASMVAVFSAMSLLEKPLKNSTKVIPALAGCMSLIAIAMTALSVPIFLLGNLKMETISRGLKALAGSFVVASLGMIVMTDAAKLLGKSSGQLAKFSVAFAGLAAAVAIISIVAPIIVKNSHLIMEAIKVMVESVVFAIKDSSDAITNVVLDIIVDVLNAVIAYLPTILVQLETVLVETLDWFIDAIPDIVDRLCKAIGVLFSEVVDGMGKYIDPKDAMIALGSLEFVYILIKQLASLKDKIKDALPAVALMGGIFAILIASFAILKELGVDGDNMPKQAIGMSLAILAMAPLMKSISYFGRSARGLRWKQVATTLTMIAGIIASISLIFWAFDKLNISTDDMIKRAASIALALTSMSPLIVALGIMSKFGSGSNWGNTIPLLTMVAGISIVLGSVFVVLDKLNIDPVYMIGYSKSLSLAFVGIIPLLLSVGLIVGVLGKLKIDAGSMMSAALGITAAISVILFIMTGLLGIIGSIEMLSGGSMAQTMEAAVPFMSSLGEAIGAIIGGLVGAISEGTLALLGKGLSEFATEAQPFFDAMNTLDPSFGDKVTALGSGIIALASSGFINAIGDLISLISGEGSLEKLGSDLALFGPYMNDFVLACSDITEDKAKGVKTAAEAIKAVVDAMPKEGGIVQWWTGTSNMEDFATNMGSVGSALMEFQKNTVGLNPDTVKVATKAGEIITAFANKLPKEGGVVQYWTGTIDMEKFADNLPKLGDGIMGFQKSVTNSNGGSAINQDSVNVAVAAAEMLLGINNNLPPTGGKLQKWLGEKSLEKFADNLPKLGKAIVDFNNEVSSQDGSKIDPGSVTTAVWVGNEVASLWNALPDSSGFGAWVNGFPDLSKFASAIGPLGEGIKTFSDSTSGINTLGVPYAISALESIAGLQTILAENNTSFWDIWKNDQRMKNFADNVPILGTGIKNLSTNMSGTNLENIKTATEAIRTLVDLQSLSENLGGFALDAFNNALKNLDISSLSTITSGVANDDNLRSMAEKFYEIGRAFIQRLYDGMKGTDQQSTLIRKTSLDLFVSTIANELAMDPNDYGSPQWIAGRNLTLGFSKGLVDAIALASLTNASKALVDHAFSVIQNTADEHSPSRRAMTDGANITKGLAIGLKDNANLVRKPAEDVAEEAFNSMTNGIKKVYELMHNGADFRPVISPVVDLSNAKKSVSEMNSLFSSSNMDVVGSTMTVRAVRIGQGIKMEKPEPAKPTDLSKITESILRIGKKLSDMENKMGELKVVMDSGELVGVITPKMIRSINKQQIKTNRGIISSRLK